MSLTATIGGVSIVLNADTVGTLKRDRTLDGRSTLEFTMEDTTGTVVIQPNQKVVFTDTVTGEVFNGFVSIATPTNLYPNTTNLIDITFIDNIYLADKRYYTGADFTSAFAGDIFAQIVESTLVAEGVQANFAIDRDVSISDFGEGLLTNTVATSNNGGDLELAPSGTSATQTYNAIAIPTFNCFKITAMAQAGYSDAYIYREVYTPTSTLTVASGDFFQYDVWISSTSPQIMAGMDFTFTDGSSFRDVTQANGAGLDQQGLVANPGQDLNGYANDQWYTRSFTLSGSLIGKTVAYFTVAFQGNTAGNYTAYFRRCFYGNGGTKKADIWNDTSTSLQKNIRMLVSGYINFNVYYLTTGHNKSYSNTTSIFLSSFIDMASIICTWDPTSIPTGVTFLQQTSIDNNASWQSVTNGTPISNLLSGGNVNTRVLNVQNTITQGTDPTACLDLPVFSVQLIPSPINNGISSSSDIFEDYTTASDWNSGTYSNANAGSSVGLELAGYWRAFNSSSDYVSTTLYNGSIYISQNSLAMTCPSTSDMKLKLGFAGNWQNFQAEMDIYVTSTYAVGFVYRTTNWGTTNDDYAYSITVNNSSIVFAHGTNSTGAGSFTLIQQVTTLSITSGTWHHLTINVSGTSHNAYIDGVNYINHTDSTYTATGAMGIRVYNSGGSSVTGFVKNFGILNGLSGTWTSPSISLAGAVTAGNSLVTWDNSSLSSTPSGASIVVQTSTNGGSSWQTATNGGTIPSLTVGQSLSGVNLLVLITMTTGSSSDQPLLNGLSVWLQPEYESTGSRVIDPLALTSVVRAGSTLVSWDGLQPTNTNIYIDSSLDGNTWTQIGSGASGSAAIAGINTAADPYLDAFETASSFYYINTCDSGGGLGTWTQNYTTNRLEVTGAAGSSAALYLYALLNTLDCTMSAVMSVAAGAGFIARYVDSQDFYFCCIQDSSYSSEPNKVHFYKVASGTRTSLASYTISFATNNPHMFTFSCIQNVMTLIMDGVTIGTYTDSSSPLGAGLTGMACYNSGNFYFFRAQGYGDIVTSEQVFTRTRLTSNNATTTPALTELTTSVRNSNIQSGVLVASTAYSVLNGSTNTSAQIFDDLVKKCGSGWWWDIDTNGIPYLQSEVAQLAAIPITAANILLSNLKVQGLDDTYRNSEWIINGTDTLYRQETFIGDGNSKTFTLGYPVSEMVGMSVNGTSATYGIKSVDNGDQFYYAVNDSSITQDTSGTALNMYQTLLVQYYGIVPTTTNAKNDTQIAAIATTDGTSGIVEMVDDGTGLTKASCVTLASAKLAQFCKQGRTIQFDTLATGLAPGQLACIFLTEHSFNGQLLLITDVVTTWRIISGGALQQVNTVSATQGSIVGDWSKFYLNLARLQ